MKLREYLHNLARNFEDGDLTISRGECHGTPAQLLQSLPASELDALVLAHSKGNLSRGVMSHSIGTQGKKGFWIFGEKISRTYVFHWRIGREGWAGEEGKLHFYRNAGDSFFMRSSCGRASIAVDTPLSGIAANDPRYCKVCLRAVSG